MNTFDENKILRGQPLNAGQFAGRVNDAPTSSLPADAVSEAPVSGTLRLQAWSYRNDLVEVESRDVDARAILDTFDLELARRALDEYDHGELLMGAMRDEVLVDHDGPHDLEIDRDEAASYLAEREAAGAFKAPRLTVKRASDEALAAFELLDAQIAELEVKRQRVALQYAEAVVTAEVPDARSVSIDPDGVMRVRDGADRVALTDDQAERILDGLAPLGLERLSVLPFGPRRTDL